MIDLTEAVKEQTIIVIMKTGTMAQEEIEAVEVEGEEAVGIMVKAGSLDPRELKVKKEDKAIVDNIEMTEVEKDAAEVDIEMIDKGRKLAKEEKRSVFIRINKLESYLRTKSKLKSRFWKKNKVLFTNILGQYSKK